MKSLILLAFLSLMAIQSYAQYKPDPEKLLYMSKVTKYKRMKNAGIALTVGGTIAAIIGISSIEENTTTTGYGGNTTTTNSDAGAALTFFAGACAMGAGVPLWIVGNHAQHKYERKLEGIMVGLNVTPQRAGLTLRYRF